jgi:hypothetical protein
LNQGPNAEIGGASPSPSPSEAAIAGGPIDLGRFRRELAGVVDLDNPHTQEGIEDALAGRPSRW